MNLTSQESKTISTALDAIGESIERIDSTMRSLTWFLVANTSLFTLNAYSFYFGLGVLGLPDLQLAPFVISQMTVFISTLFIISLLVQQKARKKRLTESLSNAVSQLEKLANSNLNKQCKTRSQQND